MTRPATDTFTPALRARELVLGELTGRGWTVREHREGGVTFLDGAQPDGRKVRVRVKAKTSGTWQATTTSARSPSERAAVPIFWVFVDLQAVPPRHFVAPDEWVRKDIARVHEQYLSRHDGRRPRNPASTHHAIAVDRLGEWAERWDQLVGPRVARRGV